MELDEDTVEGSIARSFVREGVTAYLSLGYSVDVQHTDDRLKAGAKKMLEILIVRKGAAAAATYTRTSSTSPFSSSSSASGTTPGIVSTFDV